MGNDESRLELKVGGLLVAAALGIVGLLYTMGELSLRGDARVSVDFSHTGNVVKGAPVKIGGVPVGRVDSIELQPGRRDVANKPMPVVMTLSLSKAAFAALKSDAAITVSSQGPLGEPYLEVWAGSATTPFDATASIRGVDAPRIDIVSNRLATFLESASDVLERDPQAMARLVSGLGGLTTNLADVLAENRAAFQSMVQDLTAASKDLKTVAALARTQLEPGGPAHGLIDDAAATAKVLRTDVPGLTKQASTALNGAAAVAGQFTAEDGQRMKDMLARYHAAGEKLDGLALRADRLVAKIEAGDGTLGAFIKDKQAYDDLKSLLADLRKHPWKMLWKD